MMVQLKNIDEADADLIAKWKSDPELSEILMSVFQQTTTEQAVHWITKNSSDPNQRLNGIYLKRDTTEELIGITRLMFIDFESKNAEFGIYIGENAARGHGVGQQALNLTLKQGFMDLGLEKIYLRVSEKNISAVKVYEKAGFCVEGILKEHYFSKGAFENIIFMALFKEQFL